MMMMMMTTMMMMMMTDGDDEVMEVVVTMMTATDPRHCVVDDSRQYVARSPSIRSLAAPSQLLWSMTTMMTVAMLDDTFFVRRQECKMIMMTMIILLQTQSITASTYHQRMQLWQ